MTEIEKQILVNQLIFAAALGMILHELPHRQDEHSAQTLDLIEKLDRMAAQTEKFIRDWDGQWGMIEC